MPLRMRQEKREMTLNLRRGKVNWLLKSQNSVPLCRLYSKEVAGFGRGRLPCRAEGQDPGQSFSNLGKVPMPWVETKSRQTARF
jgi:hypothetical protein